MQQKLEEGLRNWNERIAQLEQAKESNSSAIQGELPAGHKSDQFCTASLDLDHASAPECMVASMVVHVSRSACGTRPTWRSTHVTLIREQFVR
jgi:hypothetical protein